MTPAWIPIGLPRWLRLTRVVLDDLRTILAYTVKSHRGARTPHRNARLMALRDAALHRWGEMGPEVRERIMMRNKA